MNPNCAKCQFYLFDKVDKCYKGKCIYHTKDSPTKIEEVNTKKYKLKESKDGSGFSAENWNKVRLSLLGKDTK